MNRLAYIVAAMCFFAPWARAATPLSALRYMPDITVSLGTVIVGPRDVTNEAMGSVSLSLSGMPANLAAYRFTGSGHWLVFETSVQLPGGITATPRDVVGYDGTTYTLLLDGAAVGIPTGAAIDALSSTNGSDFLISFDTTVVVGGVTASSGDAVRYSGAWTKHFDGVGAGVTPGANLDALHQLSNGHLLVSFDVAGTLGGLNFSAGDVLEFTAPGTWEIAFSPLALHPGWGAANLRGLWAQEGSSPVSTPPVMGDVPDQTGTVGVAFTALSLSAHVTLTEGDPIASYAYTGTLPPGLGFNTTTGVISGTPTAAGVYSITVTASDDDGASNGDAIQFVIAAAPPGPTPPLMGNVPDQTGAVGAVFVALNLSAHVTLTEGDPIASYAYTGTLPPGLAFSTTTGVISGTPTAAGVYTVTVTASDDDGTSNGDVIQFVIAPAAQPPMANVNSVPTLSEWALLLLSLLLGLAFISQSTKRSPS